MNSGQFNTDVEFYKIDITEDDLGFTEEKRVTICKDRAYISHIKSNEIDKNNVVIYQPRHKVVIRKKNIDFDVDCLCEINGHEYNIIDIDTYSDRLTISIYVERKVV